MTIKTNFMTKAVHLFFVKIKNKILKFIKNKDLIHNSNIRVKTSNDNFKIVKSFVVKKELIKSSKISYTELLYQKNQKIKYVEKLRKDKFFFDQQQHFKTLESNLKNVQRLLVKQKEIFDKNLSLKDVQILILSNKLKDVSSLELKTSPHSTKVQISQMLFFKHKKHIIDIFPIEDILLHTNVLRLLSIAVVKSIFELYNAIDSSNHFNKFSFVIHYETFDGSSHSLSFPSNFIVTDDDVNYLVNFYEFPEKISFYNSVLEFILYLIEKYEGTSLHQISVHNTSIEWNQLKNAFKNKKN